MKTNKKEVLKKVKTWRYKGVTPPKLFRDYPDCKRDTLLEKMADDKRYNITIFGEKEALIEESLIGKVIRLATEFENNYILNGFDIKREISEFPKSEKEMKQLSKDLGKTYSIYDAVYEKDLPAFIKKGKKLTDDVDNMLSEMFPEKYIAQYLCETQVSPKQITYRKTWNEIMPGIGILNWDLCKDEDKIYDVNNVLETIFKNKKYLK